MGGKNEIQVERTERELIMTRTFDAPPRLVFAAWTAPDLFMRWWPPKSSGVPMLSCEMDVRVGGGYRVAFGTDPATAMAFFGKYTDVIPNERLVWTNEEGGEISVTTVTFEEQAGKTQLVMRELYPSKAAAEASAGMEGGTAEQFAQLDELLPELA